MLISISPSNKSNIITYMNSINKGDSEKNSDSDNGGDNDSINKDNSIKMTYTKDKPGMLVKYKTTTL